MFTRDVAADLSAVSQVETVLAKRSTTHRRLPGSSLEHWRAPSPRHSLVRNVAFEDLAFVIDGAPQVMRLPLRPIFAAEIRRKRVEWMLSYETVRFW
jgi:hypothetical protein